MKSSSAVEPVIVALLSDLEYTTHGCYREGQFFPSYILNARVRERILFSITRNFLPFLSVLSVIECFGEHFCYRLASTYYCMVQRGRKKNKNKCGFKVRIMNYLSKSVKGDELYIWLDTERYTLPLDECLDVINGKKFSVFITFDRSIKEGGLVGKDK